jgi:hypothetical protein
MSGAAASSRPMPAQGFCDPSQLSPWSDAAHDCSPVRMDSPDRPLARPTERADARPIERPAWLTYAQAGERLGLSPEAVRHRARRSGWRTMPGNDGRTLVLVPDGVEVVRTPVRTVEQTPDRTADRTPDHAEEIARAHARADRAEADRRAAEQFANEANRRADAAIALADHTLGQLAEANTRADRAEHTIAGERARADAQRDRIEELNSKQADSQAELAAAQDAAERAGIQAEAAQHGEREARRILEADRAGGRWARLRRAWRGEGAG